MHGRYGSRRAQGNSLILKAIVQLLPLWHSPKLEKESLDRLPNARRLQIPNTIFSAKRLIGRKYDEIKDEIDTLPYKVIEGKNGAAVIECDIDGNTETFMPEQISSMVLGS